MGRSPLRSAALRLPRRAERITKPPVRALPAGHRSGQARRIAWWSGLGSPPTRAKQGEEQQDACRADASTRVVGSLDGLKRPVGQGHGGFLPLPGDTRRGPTSAANTGRASCARAEIETPAPAAMGVALLARSSPRPEQQPQKRASAALSAPQAGPRGTSDAPHPSRTAAAIPRARGAAPPRGGSSPACRSPRTGVRPHRETGEPDRDRRRRRGARTCAPPRSR